MDRRRDRAARAATAKTPTSAGYCTFWVTRDLAGGVLASKVRVWVREPVATRYELETQRVGGPRVLERWCTWGAQLEDGESAYYAEWSLAECARHCPVPDDERQVVRREGWAGLWYPASSSTPAAGAA